MISYLAKNIKFYKTKDKPKGKRKKNEHERTPAPNANGKKNNASERLPLIRVLKLKNIPKL